MTRSKLSILGLLIWGIVGVQVWAQGQTLTLTQAMDWAVAHQESVRLQSESIEQSLARIDQLQGHTLPQLSASFTESYQDDALSSSGSSITSAHRPEYKLSLNQALFTGFRDSDAMAVAQSQLKTENMRLDEVCLALRRQVAAAYYAVLISQRDFEVVGQAAKASDERQSDLSRRVQLGKSRTSEWLAAQSQGLLLHAQLDQLRAQIAVGQLELARWVGKDLTDLSVGLPMVASLNMRLTAVEITDRLANRPELRRLQAQLEAAESQVRFAKRTWLPNVNLGGNYYFERTQSLSPIKWDASVSAQFPLFQGGAEFGDIRLAQSQLKVLQLTYDQQHRVLTTQLHQDLIGLRSAISQQQLMADAVTKIESSYRLSVNEYQRGLVTNLEVLSSLDQVVSAKRTQTRAVVDVAAKTTDFNLTWGGAH